ncbi:MAG: 50S ribosomal protein L24 [Candidatus Woesearchaeota archaeon]
MKQSFSKSWLESKQPRKQRKYRYNAPLHILGDFVNVNLSKELRKKYSSRSVRVKKGDKIKVLRGQHKGKSGKVERVSLKYSRVYVAGVELIKKDGTKNLIPLEPSNLQIIEVDTSDKLRFKKINNEASK